MGRRGGGGGNVMSGAGRTRLGINWSREQYNGAAGGDVERAND